MSTEERVQEIKVQNDRLKEMGITSLLKRLQMPELKDLIYHHYAKTGKGRPSFLWKYRKSGLIKFIQDNQIEKL